MEPGDDISQTAKAWGGLLTIAELLILGALTVGAFKYNIIFGLVWLFVGVPISAGILYAFGLVLFAPVAIISGGREAKRKKTPAKEALGSTPGTLTGLKLADYDQHGVVELHDDGLVFRSGKKKPQVFAWSNIDSFGLGDEKGLFLNTFDGRWALVLHSIEGDDRTKWRDVFGAHGVSEHETFKVGSGPHLAV